MLKFGHDIAVDESHLVAGEKLGAVGLEIVVDAFELDEQLAFFLLHDLSVGRGFEIGVEFDVEIAARLLGRFVRAEIERGETRRDVLFDAQVVREHDVLLDEHDHGRLGVVLFELGLGILHVHGEYGERQLFRLRLQEQHHEPALTNRTAALVAVVHY